MPTTAAEHRRRVLERARERRRRRAVVQRQDAVRRATFLGGAIGLVAGVLVGVLLRDTAPAGPSIAAVIGLVVGACAGAAVVLGREQADQLMRERAEARAREEERARRREQERRERERRPVVAAPKLLAEQERRERKRRPVVAAPKLLAEPETVPQPPATPASAHQPAADEDFLVPPGFYPDPDGGERHRWWDGAKWTARRAA